jgi:hypothetical protein
MDSGRGPSLRAVAIDLRRATELGSEHNERIVEQTTTFEIGEESAKGFVEFSGTLGQERA